MVLLSEAMLLRFDTLSRVVRDILPSSPAGLAADHFPRTPLDDVRTHHAHRSRSQLGMARCSFYDDTAVNNRYRLPLGLRGCDRWRVLHARCLPDDRCRHNEGDLRVGAGGVSRGKKSAA